MQALTDSERSERLFLHDGERSGVLGGGASAEACYCEATPSPALAPYLAAIGVCSERIAPGQVVEERVVPDGAVRIVFNLGDPPRQGDADPGAAALVVGPASAPATVRLEGTVDGLSVELRPGTAAALLGVPAGELAGRGLELREVWGDFADETVDRLTAAAGAHARIAIVEAAVRSVLAARRATVHPAAAHAVRLIAASHGRLATRELALRLGVGERRLEQIFHQHVGLSPKRVARLARFRAGLRMLQARPRRPFSEIAIACGWYDQSHMINEIRAIAGVTPTELAGDLVSVFSKTQA